MAIGRYDETVAPQTAASRYRTSLNKAFTIEIDGLLRMLPALNQALPPSLRSLGRVSVNRSKTCTLCVGDDVPAEGPLQRLLTVCANGWCLVYVN